MGRDIIIEDLQEIDFQKLELPTTMNVSNAKTVCPGQEITIKAKVAHIQQKQLGKIMWCKMQLLLIQREQLS